jgi:hypothetical protein
MSKPAVNPVNQLGRRLRQSNSPSQEDLEQLGEIVEMSGFTLDIVERQLRLLGLDLTTRLKNTFTIIEKLKREPSLQLSKIESAWEFRRLSRLGERMESWKRSELGTRGIRLS